MKRPAAVAAGLFVCGGIWRASASCCEPGLTTPREVEFQLQAEQPVELRAIAADDLPERHDYYLPDYYLVDAAGRVSLIDEVHVWLSWKFKWFELLAPDGGWGALRTATQVADAVVLSDGESLLLADGNPLQDSWQRIEAPTEVLTFGNDEGLLIGGRQGRVMRTTGEEPLGSNSTWTEIQLGTDADVVAIEGRGALTDAGELFDLDTLDMLDVGDANAGMAYANGVFVLFGANGPLITTDYESCTG